MPDAEKTKELITMLCREAGEMLRTAFTEKSSEEWKRGATRFSELELRLMYLAAAFIQNYFPKDRLFGQDEAGDFSGRVWVCDPIDGSYFFTHGIPLYTFSMSLLVDGQPQIAAVYEPTTDHMYFAAKGEGSILNGTPITMFHHTSLSDHLIMLSGSHGKYIDLGGLHNHLKELGAKPIISYSTVQHTAMVATGEVVGVICGIDFIQDITATKLIVEEAGGLVTNLIGKPHNFTDSTIYGFVASSAQIHPELLKAASAFLVSPH